MTGLLDPFEFILAESLGMTRAELQRMGNDEYLQWRAFHTWRAAMQEQARKG